jgi:hypothetical protein
MMGAYLNGQSTPGYRVGPGMMGYAYGYTPATSSRGGWPTGAGIAVTILAVLLIIGGLARARRSVCNASATPPRLQRTLLTQISRRRPACRAR